MKKIISFIILASTLLSCLPVHADNEAYLNDPFYEQMWHYDAIKAHSFGDNGIDGRGVKVGVIDSGFTKELDKFPEFCDFDGIDIQTGKNICAEIDNNDELMYDTSDNGYHGTSVASIICAKANNEYGIAGLTDSCTVIPYKVEDYRCSKTANSLLSIIKAIDEAYKDGCEVVNISQGTDANLESKYIDMLNIAVDRAVQNGMIIVASAGNSGKGDNHIEYPAACDNVIGVGAARPDCEAEDICIDGTTGLLKPESEATIQDEGSMGYHRAMITDFPDSKYVKLELSTANESVFVCAPGVDIPAVECRNYEYIKRPFASRLGTSDATPIVASAAIGVKQMRPYVDTDIFKEILKATAVDLDAEGYDINTGYGMVDYERIYDYVSQMPLTAPERTPEITIDFENEQLVGFPINREYTINGEAVTLNDDFSLPIKDEWFGTTVEIVKKASSESYEDSIPQELVIPARPETPKLELMEDKYIKGVGSDIWYREETSTNWQSGYDAEDYTIMLEPGKTYVFKIKYTESSFASEIRRITVQFVDTEQYDIETSIVYDPDTGECTYSAVNNTIWTINAVGIIAVYAQNGVLKHLEAADAFPSDGFVKKLNFTVSDGDTVRFFVWDSFENMKPKDKVKLSELTIS